MNTAKKLLQAPATGGRSYSLKIAPKFAVDRASGMLRDVALLSVGEAKGHGIFIDERTIETAAEVVAAKKGRLKAAFRHPSMLDYITSHGADRMLEIPGYFSAVAAKGEQLVAGVFQFYDTFKKTNAAHVDTLLEMADKTPELFGVSIEPYGYLAYVDENDDEYSEPPIDRELKYNGLPALRVTDLAYAAFVDEPAANPGGVFATLSKLPGLGALFGGGAQRRQLEALGRLAEAVAVFCKSNGPDSAASDVEPARAEETNHDQVTMNTLTAIHAKYGSDPMKFASACKLLAEDSKLTIDQIDAKLAAAKPAAAVAAPAAEAPKGLELSAISAKFGADKGRLAKAFEFVAGKPDATIEQIEAHLSAQDAAELKRLQDAHAKAQADLAAKDREIATLKASGHPAPVALGAAAGLGSGTDAKPRELKGIDRIAAAFKADTHNPANVGRN
jgi:hypothetical protein